MDDLLYDLAESLRIIAILISPVLPKAAHGIFDQLNWKMELSGKEERFRLQTRNGEVCRMDMSLGNRSRCSRALKPNNSRDDSVLSQILGTDSPSLQIVIMLLSERIWSLVFIPAWSRNL